MATTAWDYVVVGSDPVGIITASRLSENLAKSVPLLEDGCPPYGVRGGTEKPAWLSGTSLSRVDVPRLYLFLFSAPSSMTCGKNVNAFGGCTIGGSSAINGGPIFERPASDFDTYSPTGWKHADLVPSIDRLYAIQPSSDAPSAGHLQYLQSGYLAAKNWLITKVSYTELSINGNAAQKPKFSAIQYTTATMLSVEVLQ